MKDAYQVLACLDIAPVGLQVHIDSIVAADRMPVEDLHSSRGDC